MIWVLIIAVITGLDRFTKYLILNSNIVNGNPIIIINNFFKITYVENKGAAWGILQNGRYFFIVTTILLSIVLIYYLIKTNSTFFKLSLAFVLGGAMGNFIDRLLRGSVVDFIEFNFGSYHFPVFNIADIFVVVGTFIMAYYILFEYKEDESKG